jgi:hypothetical protein
MSNRWSCYFHSGDEHCFLTRIWLQVYKDPMHALEHGVFQTIFKCIILSLQRISVEMIPDASDRQKSLCKNLIANRFIDRMHLLCDKRSTMHTTLVCFQNQSILQFFQALANGEKAPSQVDCSDVQKMMLQIPFLLHGITYADEHRLSGSDQSKFVARTLRIIETVSLMLRWYSVYRQPSISVAELDEFHEMSKLLMKETKETFDFPRSETSDVSIWTFEKFHSLIHAASNRKEMGALSNFSTQTTESKHKSVRKYGGNTNKKPGFALSLLTTSIRTSTMKRSAAEHVKNGEMIECLKYG